MERIEGHENNGTNDGVRIGSVHSHNGYYAECDR